MNCGSCDYWTPDEADARVSLDATGDCRRHAPVATVDANGEMWSVWPVTFARNGCGDFQRHLTRRIANVSE